MMMMVEAGGHVHRGESYYDWWLLRSPRTMERLLI